MTLTEAFKCGINASEIGRFNSVAGLGECGVNIQHKIAPDDPGSR